MTKCKISVLYITSQYPTKENSGQSAFIRIGIQSLLEAGINVDIFHYIGRWNPIYYYVAIKNFRKQIKLESYDLIHVHFGQCGLVAISQRQIPIVVRFGGSDLMGWVDENGREPLKSKLLTGVSRFVARRAAAVILPSQAMAEHLPDKPYTVIPAGIDLDMFVPGDPFEARRQLALPVDKKLVLFAADPDRIVKRYHLARSAVKIIQETMPVELVVAGSIPHNLMPVYMRACDVLVLTSQHEGSPNVVKEALACNLPVVSVDVGDVRSRIGDAPACEVCAGDDPQDIAAGLLRVLSSKRPNELQHLVSQLDKRIVASQIIEVYKRVLFQ